MVKIHLFFIHGIDEQEKGYSKELYRKIKDSYIYKKKGAQDRPILVRHEIFWEEITRPFVKKFQDKQDGVKKGLAKSLLGQFINVEYLFFQILFYTGQREEVLKKVASEFENLEKNKDDKVVVIAHSLGAVIVFDWLFNHKASMPIDGFFMMGSPLPLFITAMKWSVGDKDRAKTVAGEWFDLADHRDIFAHPCDRHLPEGIIQRKIFKFKRGISKKTLKPGMKFRKKIEKVITVHDKYWESPEVADFISDKLI